MTDMYRMDRWLPPPPSLLLVATSRLAAPPGPKGPGAER